MTFVLDPEALLHGQPGSEGFCSERWWGKVNWSLVLKVFCRATEENSSGTW